MKNLEIVNVEKDTEIYMINQDYKTELREQDDDQKGLNESVGGYNITLSDSSHP